MPDPSTWHKIEKDSIKESWTRSGGVRAEVTYRCLYAERFALMQELIGGYSVKANSFSAFTVPHSYPPLPHLYAVDISDVKGEGLLKGGGSKWSPYKYALVTTVYESPNYAVNMSSADSSNQIDPASPVLYCRQTIRGSAAFVTLPDGKLKYSASGKTVDAPAARPQAQAEIGLEFPRVRFNPYLFLRPYLGKTNLFAMFGHPPGQVFFDSVDTDDSASTDGLDHSVKLAFLGRDADWNALVNEAGDYELVEFKSGGRRPFTQVDLYQMFA